MHRVPNVSPSNQPQSSLYFARPDDMAVNIQRGCPTSRASIGNSRSPFPSPETSSSQSDMDYAERVAMQNNVEVDKTIAQSKESIQLSDMACAYPHASSKTAPNNTRELDPLS